MLKNIWSILANYASIDEETKAVSVFGIAENIDVVLPQDAKDKPAIALPGIHHELISLWRRTGDSLPEEHYQIQYRLMDPKGNNLATATNSLQFNQDQTAQKHRAKLNDLTITIAGDYSIDIFVVNPQGKVKKHNSLPFSVSIKYDV